MEIVDKSQLLQSLKESSMMIDAVPICANCQRIRDNRGYWELVEAYVSKHTEARLSHSLCPACMKILYPEYCREGEPEAGK